MKRLRPVQVDIVPWHQHQQEIYCRSYLWGDPWWAHPCLTPDCTIRELLLLLTDKYIFVSQDDSTQLVAVSNDKSACGRQGIMDPRRVGIQQAVKCF